MHICSSASACVRLCVYVRARVCVCVRARVYVCAYMYVKGKGEILSHVYITLSYQWHVHALIKESCEDAGCDCGCVLVLTFAQT